MWTRVLGHWTIIRRLPARDMINDKSMASAYLTLDFCYCYMLLNVTLPTCSHVTVACTIN